MFVRMFGSGAKSLWQLLGAPGEPLGAPGISGSSWEPLGAPGEPPGAPESQGAPGELLGVLDDVKANIDFE